MLGNWRFGSRTGKMARGRDAVAGAPIARFGVRVPAAVDPSKRPDITVPLVVPLRIPVFGLLSEDVGRDAAIVSFVGLNRIVLVDMFRAWLCFDWPCFLLGDIA